MYLSGSSYNSLSKQQTRSSINIQVPPSRLFTIVIVPNLVLYSFFYQFVSFMGHPILYLIPLRRLRLSSPLSSLSVASRRDLTPSRAAVSWQARRRLGYSEPVSVWRTLELVISTDTWRSASGTNDDFSDLQVAGKRTHDGSGDGVSLFRNTPKKGNLCGIVFY